MLRKTLPFSVAPLLVAVRRSLVVSLGGMLSVAPLAALAQEETINTGTTVVTATALKVDTPEVETPRAISTVSAEELETRGVNKYDETFQYRSGVVSQPYGDDNNAITILLFLPVETSSCSVKLSRFPSRRCLLPFVVHWWCRSVEC